MAEGQRSDHGGERGQPVDDAPGAGAAAPSGARLRLDAPRCAAAIAALLGASLDAAPFRHRGAPIPRLTLRNAALGVPVRLDLWPALARVDVALSDCFFVFTGVEEVLLIPGAEVLFRRSSPRGFLFVTVNGVVSLKC